MIDNVAEYIYNDIEGGIFCDKKNGISEVI